MTKKIIQISNNPVYDFGMVSTVFAKDTEFCGELSYKKSLQINGIFEGDINTGGYLIVGETAVVKANIKARAVIIMGTVYGNVEALERLEIQLNGKLHGNIRTAKLKIADGVVFEGKCEMIRPDEKKMKKEAPAAENLEEKIG